MATFLGIILALLPSYLLRFKIFGLPTTFLEVLIVVFLFAVVGRFIGQKKLINQLTTLRQLGQVNYAIGLFLLAGIISTVISPEPLKALGQLKAFVVEPILLFYATLLTIKTEADLKVVLRWLFASAGLISLLGLIQYFTHLGLPLRFWGGGLEPKRIVSVFDYPNALALYLSPLFVFYLALRLKQHRLVNPQLFSLVLAVMALALYLTFSRGAWLAVILTLIVLLFKSVSFKHAAAATVIALLVVFLISPIRQRLSFQDASSLTHIDLWQAAASKLAQNPILGNGLSGFRTTLADSAYTGEFLNYPHNIFLNFWLELGLLGLVSFTLILFYSYKQYQKQPTILRLAAMAFMLTLLIHGLVDVPYFKNDLSVLFWFTISIFYIDV